MSYLMSLIMFISSPLTIGLLFLEKSSWHESGKVRFTYMNHDKLSSSSFETEKRDTKLLTRFSIDKGRDGKEPEIRCRIVVRNISDESVYLLIDGEDSLSLTATLSHKKPNIAFVSIYLSRLLLDSDSELTVLEIPELIEIKPGAQVEREEILKIEPYLLRDEYSVKLILAYLDQSSEEQCRPLLESKDSSNAGDKINKFCRHLETDALIIPTR